MGGWVGRWLTDLYLRQRLASGSSWAILSCSRALHSLWGGWVSGWVGEWVVFQ